MLPLFVRYVSTVPLDAPATWQEPLMKATICSSAHLRTLVD